jgi:uncharacterized protein (DUF983 family)
MERIMIREADPFERRVPPAMMRGLRGRCPCCGEGRLFGGFLKVRDHCEACGEALYHHRADDAPPYVVITIVGHIVIAIALVLEKWAKPEVWLLLTLLVPLTLILSLALLQPIKGGLVGIQWALRMHGFDPSSTEAAEPPPAARP